MLKSKNISVLAVLAVFATTPVFADIASTQYTERKTSVSDTTNAAVGKIAVYAADGSGQKIAAGMLGLPSENGTSGQVLKSNGAGGVIWGTDNNSNTYHSISVNGGTATTSGSVSLYAPTAAGTSGQVLIA
ncbi:MAG: hypothetical protein LBL75_00955, partial [Rickettsiales bacterium]|nr:hypothetical protein [Rickettsiales bacterium]